MAIPSLADLANEISTGALAASLANYWADVFETETAVAQVAPTHADYQKYLRFLRVQPRFGKLKSAAAHDILHVLSEPTRTVTISTISRADFAARIAPLAIKVALLANATKREQWRDIFAMLPTLGDPIVITRPELQGLFNLAQADGLMNATERAAFNNGGTALRSRLFELGWEVTEEMIVAAKGGA